MKLPIRAILISILFLLIFVQVLFLSPRSLENVSQRKEGIQIAELTLKTINEKSLAPGIPQKQVPDYQIESLNYVAIVQGHRDWQVISERADIFSIPDDKNPDSREKNKLVHAREVVADLYQTDGKTTHVVGKEAKYLMNKRELEMFGDVKTRLPDGFEIESQYMKYLPETGTILIPQSEPVHGKGKTSDAPNAQTMKFASLGLDYPMKENVITLPAQVKVEVLPPPENENDAPTTITSDVAHIFRTEHLSKFEMYPTRPIKERFVVIDSPDWHTTSRLADLSYGDSVTGEQKDKETKKDSSAASSSPSALNYLVALQDVTIVDTRPPEDPSQEDEKRWGTGGRATFDNRLNRVVLTEFPQVYQNNDTVTGDRITLYRDSDIVEVEHSNAFNEGKSGTKKKNTQSSESGKSVQGTESSSRR